MKSSPLYPIMIFLTFALAAWYFIGVQLNRRRANQLARFIARAVPTLGGGATIRPIGSGSSGFQIELQEPVPELRKATLLCILEARDFPLAWLYTRLRGRRDQLILRADLKRPPRAARRYSGPLPDRGLPRLMLLETHTESPHLRLSLGIGGGEEGQIAPALELALQVARGEWPVPGEAAQQSPAPPARPPR